MDVKVLFVDFVRTLNWLNFFFNLLAGCFILFSVFQDYRLGRDSLSKNLPDDVTSKNTGCLTATVH